MAGEVADEGSATVEIEIESAAVVGGGGLGVGVEVGAAEGDELADAEAGGAQGFDSGDV